MDNKESYAYSEDFRKRFGERLRGLRKDNGYTIENVTSQLGLPRSTYNGWELGKRIPLTKSLDSLAKFYNTSVDYLLLKTDNKSSESLEDILINKLTWEGKELTQEQIKDIQSLIQIYLKNQ